MFATSIQSASIIITTNNTSQSDINLPPLMLHRHTRAQTNKAETIGPPRINMLLPLDRARLASRMVPTSIPLGGDHDFKSATPDPTTVVKVLILVSVFGWVFFGIMSILCINGRGRAGRWVPEWYLDSRGSRWDLVAVVAWWVTVMVLWPIILPALVVRMGVKGMVRHCRRGEVEDGREDK